MPPGPRRLQRGAGGALERTAPHARPASPRRRRWPVAEAISRGGRRRQGAVGRAMRRGRPDGGIQRARRRRPEEIGRASCRERGWSTVVGSIFKKKSRKPTAVSYEHTSAAKITI